MRRIEAVKEDLAQLVAFRSVSGEEGRLASYIAKMHSDLGHEVHRIGNGVVVRFAGKDPTTAFVLNGHIDTVPDTGWQSDPYSLREENGRWFGLGVNDMKIGIAVMNNFGKIFAKNKPPGDVYGIFSDMEEVDGSGTVRIMDWLSKDYPRWNQYQRKAGIILEPTRDGDKEFICDGQKGGALLRVEALGPSGHGGQDYSKSPTALTKVTSFLGDARRLQKTWEIYGDNTGNPTITPTRVFDYSEAGNVVAPRATGIADVRTTAEFNRAWAGIRNQLEDDYAVKLEFSWWPRVEAGDPGSEIVAFAGKILPNTVTRAFPLASDLSSFRAHEVPMLLYGPGNLRKIHTPEESLDPGPVIPYMRNLQRMIREFPVYTRSS